MAQALPLIPMALAKVGALVGGAAGAAGAAAGAGGAAAAGAGGLTVASGLTAASTALSAGVAAKQLLTKTRLPDAPKPTALPDDVTLNAARRRRLAAEVAATGAPSTMLSTKLGG